MIYPVQNLGLDEFMKVGRRINECRNNIISMYNRNFAAYFSPHDYSFKIILEIEKGVRLSNSLEEFVSKEPLPLFKSNYEAVNEVLEKRGKRLKRGKFSWILGRWFKIAPITS